jgi:FMN phosphatase YigB (HAD superfamily)
MFWARVDALRPLFEAGITAEDFEEEPAGTDGTLAHAVERVIDITARDRGYRSVEFDRDTAQWRDNWSTRNAPRLEELPLDHLREQMLAARLVSVDLFDTLDLRPTLSPTTLQYFAARHLLPAKEAESAVRDRLEAEAAARRAPEREGDVTLREIHRHLAAVRSDADDLIRFEQEIEHACAVPRPSLLALLVEAHAAGVRIVLMSDTTLPRPEIEQLLSEVGAGDLFDELYLSNEMLARKDTGTMWQVVEQLEQVPRDAWVHLGDNEFSDLQMPATMGIGHLHVPAPAGIAQFHRFVGTAPGQTRATQAVVGSATVGLFGEHPADWSPVRRFGYSGLGPLLAAFVGWLALHPAVTASDHVLFVARDGALPYEAVRRLRPFLPPSLGRSQYFLCSRRTALAVASAGEPALHLVLGGNFRGTLHDLLTERIGLALPDDPQLHRPVELPRDHDECVLALAPHLPAISAHACTELAAFRWYLHSLGIEPQHTLALVDLGYSATTQRALATVVPNRIAGLYGATSPRARDASDEGLELHALFGRDVEWGQGHGILDHSMLLEALFAADHGQVQQFSAGGGGLRVHLKDHARTDADRAQIREAQEAAIEFCTDLVSRWGPAVFEEAIDPAAALDPWQYVLSSHTPWATALFRQLTVDDQFTGFGRAPVR